MIKFNQEENIMTGSEFILLKEQAKDECRFFDIAIEVDKT
jgi:hypothetical protein